ncbi:hypothetical protein PV04_02565 [Phialophora macrospora]|uniref:Uncharacterized protein n=1 Tax=Phialophora macrospora TaxID=1851006 RepID=A0A0D2FUT1_9EURO|nr:hypothetical protein PV04_02565 [Phialophora macrospora]
MQLNCFPKSCKPILGPTLQIGTAYWRGQRMTNTYDLSFLFTEILRKPRWTDKEYAFLLQGTSFTVKSEAINEFKGDISIFLDDTGRGPNDITEKLLVENKLRNTEIDTLVERKIQRQTRQDFHYILQFQHQQSTQDMSSKALKIPMRPEAEGHRAKNSLETE